MAQEPGFICMEQVKNMSGVKTLEDKMAARLLPVWEF